MKSNFQSKIINFNDSGLGCILTLVIVSLLLGSIGLQWIVNGFLILIALLIITSIIAVFVFRWWLKRNLIEDQCPVCDYTFTALNNNNCYCPNCGESLSILQGKFVRETQPGTIDVEAIEVSPKILED